MHIRLCLNGNKPLFKRFTFERKADLIPCSPFGPSHPGNDSNTENRSVLFAQVHLHVPRSTVSVSRHCGYE